MLQMPLKEVVKVEILLSKIPTKDLYRLQVCVTQEVKSHTRIDATELEEIKNDKENLELMVKQVKFDTKEENENADKIEQGVTKIYNHLLDNV
jgi:hypothetical protein